MTTKKLKAKTTTVKAITAKATTAKATTAKAQAGSFDVRRAESQAAVGVGAL
jgi:hypothetical protein